MFGFVILPLKKRRRKIYRTLFARFERQKEGGIGLMLVWVLNFGSHFHSSSNARENAVVWWSI